MKSSLFVKAGIVALLLSLLQPAGSLASSATLVYPSIADSIWYNSPKGSYILGFNSAMIQYNNFALGYGALMVSDYYGNGIGGGVVFRDQPSGYQVQVPYHSAASYAAYGLPERYYMFASPDIIVGNDSMNPLTSYRVAVAYIVSARKRIVFTKTVYKFCNSRCWDNYF